VVRRPRAVRRRVWIGLGIAGGMTAVALAGLTFAAASARPKLQMADREARDGLAALKRGDPAAAASSLMAAADALDRAQRDLNRPWAQLSRLVPIAAQHRAIAADLASETTGALRAAGQAVGGVDLGRLRMKAGQIDIGAVRALATPLRALQGSLTRLDAVLGRERSVWLAGPLRHRLDELATEVDDNRTSADRAAAAVGVAPGMLGANGPRHYLVAFVTPAEARPMGGYMGNFAEITADGGRITMSRFGRTTDLVSGGGHPAGRTITGPADYLRRYGLLGAGGAGKPAAPDWWKVVTISPDFPSVAQVIQQLYPQSGGRPVDGVFSVDPAGIAALLDVIGPVRVPSLAEPMTASGVAQFLVRDQYLVIPDQGNAARVDLLDAVARTTMQKLLGGQLPDPTRLARSFGGAIDGHHVMAWTDHRDEAKVLADAGLSGAFPSRKGTDLLAVTTTNSGGNKVDVYLDKDVRYEATWDPTTGAVAGRVDVRFTNRAPSTGPPDYVIGNPWNEPKGTNRMIVAFYTPLELGAVAVDASPMAVTRSSELGWNVYSGEVVMPPGGISALHVEFHGSLPRGRPYELATFHQPTGDGDRLSWRVTTPGGSFVAEGHG
jgi:hypothetical protein